MGLLRPLHQRRVRHEEAVVADVQRPGCVAHAGGGRPARARPQRIHLLLHAQVSCRVWTVPNVVLLPSAFDRVPEQVCLPTTTFTHTHFRPGNHKHSTCFPNFFSQNTDMSSFFFYYSIVNRKGVVLFILFQKHLPCLISHMVELSRKRIATSSLWVRWQFKPVSAVSISDETTFCWGGKKIKYAPFICADVHLLCHPVTVKLMLDHFFNTFPFPSIEWYLDRKFKSLFQVPKTVWLNHFNKLKMISISI